MKEPTMIEALQNLGRLIDNAIEKIHIWEDDPGDTRKALKDLKITRKHVRTYLRARSRGQRNHDLSMITKAVFEPASRQNQLPKSRTLTQEEQHRLLAELQRGTDQRLRLLVPLILFTGIRPTEALSLTWRNIDTEQMCLSITRSARYGPMIPIPNVLLPVITEHRAWFQQTFGNAEPHHYVLPTPSNPNKHARDFRREWWRLLSQAGIQCTLHDLRHTCIAGLAETGTGEVITPSQIGHYSHKPCRYLQNCEKPSS